MSASSRSDHSSRPVLPCSFRLVLVREQDQWYEGSILAVLLLISVCAVALSRAREGLYVLGNAQDLQSQSKMWRDVLEILEKDGAVGSALPVACYRHQDQTQFISKPKQLARLAPDGELNRYLSDH